MVLGAVVFNGGGVSGRSHEDTVVNTAEAFLRCCNDRAGQRDGVSAGNRNPKANAQTSSCEFVVDVVKFLLNFTSSFYKLPPRRAVVRAARTPEQHTMPSEVIKYHPVIQCITPSIHHHNNIK